MTESHLTEALLHDLKLALLGAVILKHSDHVTSGIPDFSVTWHGRTSWWEAKLANPAVKGTGLQALTMKRLAAAGMARYIIWEIKRDVTRTMIVHPNFLDQLLPEAFTTGFDRKWLIEHIRQFHAA